jgi:hypothetical protein
MIYIIQLHKHNQLVKGTVTHECRYRYALRPPVCEFLSIFCFGVAMLLPTVAKMNIILYNMATNCI